MSDPFWKDLFSEEDFKWGFKMRSGNAGAFFSSTEFNQQILNEKAHFLRQNPERYSIWTPEGLELFANFKESAERWTPHLIQSSKHWTPLNLAMQWEPDFLIMDQSTMQLAGGCICFPSSWDLSRVIGLPVQEIHELVPQLNKQIGEKVHQFLKRLQPGRSFLRENWGLTQTSDLNYHPALNRPKLTSQENLNTAYLRVEHQIFTGIPGGVLMGIRINTCPVTDLQNSPQAWKALVRKLQTMPNKVSQYKSLPRGSVKES